MADIPAFLARMGTRLLVAVGDAILKPFGGRIDIAYPDWDQEDVDA